MSEWITVALHGPNHWSKQSVLQLYAPASETEQKSIASGAVAAALDSFLDSGRFTTSHGDSVGVAKKCCQSMRLAENYGALWRAVAGWMSAMAGVPSAEFFIEDDNLLQTQDHGLTLAAILEIEEEPLGRKCFQLAADWIREIEAHRDIDIPAKFRELFDFADDIRLGPSSRAILAAATKQGIPFRRLTTGSLVRLGEGRYQRRIWTAETDATSAIGEAVASDKDLTKRLLRNVGVPVPLGRMVKDVDDAWAAAQEVGLPVVVKPRNANHQRGISIELTERNQVIRAYRWAVEDGQTQDVMVEQFARGLQHRLLVVGNAVVAASRGHSDTVTGDGIKTVAQLVHELNQDPRRGEAYTDLLTLIKMDAGAQIELSKQGLAVNSIPAKGRVVLVQRTGDLTIDCTDDVNSETARQAVLAAKVVGLDVAGLDVLARDIRKPLTSQQGAFVEVNAGPSLAPHITPLVGKPRPVGEAILRLLYPETSNGRIHIVAVLADRDPSNDHDFERVLRELHKQGLVVAWMNKQEIYVGQSRIDLDQLNANERAEAILGHPDVEALVMPIGMNDFGAAAFPLPRIDRLVFASVCGLGDDSKELARAWRTIANAVHSETVFEWLNLKADQIAHIENRLRCDQHTNGKRSPLASSPNSV